MKYYNANIHKQKLLSCTLLWYCLLCCRGGCNFASVDEILKCDHSNKSYLAVLSCGTVYYPVRGGSYF